jgi:hypothetical protein
MKQQAFVDETFVHGADLPGPGVGQAEIHEPTVHMHGIEPMLQVITKTLHGGTSLGSESSRPII